MNTKNYGLELWFKIGTVMIKIFIKMFETKIFIAPCTTHKSGHPTNITFCIYFFLSNFPKGTEIYWILKFAGMYF